MKTCGKCGIEKHLSEFYKSSQTPDGLYGNCKLCKDESQKKRDRSVDGLIAKIYSQQRTNSIKRGHNPPEYSLQGLIDWCREQENFKRLYGVWVHSNYNKKLRPSIDRINDSIGYCYENIQLMTCEENIQKGRDDRRSGINNKINSAVLQYSPSMELIKEFNSIAIACRETGVDSSGITKNCKGKRKSAGGFIWKYKEDNQ